MVNVLQTRLLVDVGAMLSYCDDVHVDTVLHIRSLVGVGVVD